VVKRLVSLMVVCVAGLFFSSAIYGQATGSFSGTVVDQSRSSVVGATVRVVLGSTGLTREAKTDDVGHYLIPLLPVGNYNLSVEMTGFKTIESRDIRLQVDEQRELDFTLAPATVAASIEVSATEVAVETTNPSLGQVITSQEVAQLPLNGRDFVQLATLTPGTTQETNPNSFFTSAASSEVAARGSFSLSVGGSRPNSTDWMLDGVDNNELTAGGIAVFSSIDSIQEFKVLTYNYSAEYGTRAGPTVLVTSKSGTNDFHGSLFEFLRNTSLDAKSFFATSAEKFNLNQFGGSIGGRIRKNKTFFFVDGEQKFQRHGITFTGLVPSLAMRNGDFSSDAFGNAVPGIVIVNPNMVGTSTDPNTFPNIYFHCDPAGNPLPANANGSQAAGTACNKIPATLFNSASTAAGIGQAMMNLYPTPNANNPALGFNFVNSPVRKLDQTKFDIRLDNNFSRDDSAFARFSYDQAVSFVPGGAPGFAEQNAFGSNQGIQNHARNIAIGETHVFTPTTVNQASFGYNRIFNYITSQGTGSCASAQLGITGANLGCDSSNKCAPGAYSCGLVSTFFLSTFWSLGDRGYTPFQGGTNIFSFSDSLNLIRGKHNIRTGVSIRANQMNVGAEAFQDGFWIPAAIGNFTGYSGAVNIAGNPEADLLLGLVGVSQHDQTFNGPVSGRRWKIVRPFVQDDWRVTKDLTLNLGLAWDLTSPVTEVDGRLANYVPTTQQLLVAGKNGVSDSAGVDRNWTAFEPRIGLAWKVLGSDKTAVRAGYAVYHDSAWSMGAQGLWQNPPFFAESDGLGFSQQAKTPGFSGCPFATSYCNTVLGLGTSGFGNFAIAQGFPIFNTAPTSPAAFTGTLFTQPKDFHLGLVQQFNANVEHQLPGNVVLTVGYAGSRGRHILVAGNDLNTGSPVACGTVSGYTLGCAAGGAPSVPPAPPNGNKLLLFGDVGKTTYNSLQIKAETKTPKYGLYALIGYTFSHTYDNGLSDGLGSLLSAPYFPLPNWPNLDWAYSQIHLANSFTASAIYDLPFGRGKQFGHDWNGAVNSLLGNWQVTIIEKITSGFGVPLVNSVNQSGQFPSFDNGGNGNNFNRPNRVAGCDAYAASHSANLWINPSCFVAAPPGELGNASRVPVTGPGFVNTDFSIIKQFALPREGMGLNFRAEFFNLFNHPQFGLPIGDISSPGFGSVNSTVNNPRLVQFGLKLTF
jgi:Carboxypeptidase regulatory-like domain